MTTLALAALLGAVFAVMVGSADPLSLALGLGAGLIILGVRPPHERLLRGWSLRRLVHLPRFAVGVFLELARGSLTMLRVLLGLQSWRRGGLVEVAVGPRSEGAVVLNALVVTAAPGTVLIQMDEDDRVMLLHSIDASDPDALRRDLDRFYHVYQRPLLQ